MPVCSRLRAVGWSSQRTRSNSLSLARLPAAGRGAPPPPPPPPRAAGRGGEWQVNADGKLTADLAAPLTAHVEVAKKVLGHYVKVYSDE